MTENGSNKMSKFTRDWAVWAGVGCGLLGGFLMGFLLPDCSLLYHSRETTGVVSGVMVGSAVWSLCYFGRGMSSW